MLHADLYLLLNAYNSYTPDLIEPLLTLASAVTRQKRFMPREREQSILAILAVYDVPYVLYTHSEIALVAGLSKEQVQQAVHGKVPDGLSEEEAMVYSLSLKLASIRGPLDQADFGKTENVFGRERIAGLAHIVSGYIYAAMLTNVADSGVPERKDGVFLATKNPAFG